MCQPVVFLFSLRITTHSCYIESKVHTCQITKTLLVSILQSLLSAISVRWDWLRFHKRHKCQMVITITDHRKLPIICYQHKTDATKLIIRSKPFILRANSILLPSTQIIITKFKFFSGEYLTNYLYKVFV